MEQLKQEITRLLALVEVWQAEGNIAEIERDLALERLREIYHTLRFGLHEAPQSDEPADAGGSEGVATAVAAVADITPTEEEPCTAEECNDDKESEENEPEIEVELIMPDEEEDDEEYDDEDEDDSHDEEDDEEEDDEEGDYDDGDEEEEAQPEPKPEPATEPEPQHIAEPEPIIEPEPQHVAESEPQPVPTPQPAPQPQQSFEQSLFGSDTTAFGQTRRRSVLMSLYEDDLPAKEPHTVEPQPKAEPTTSEAAPKSTQKAEPAGVVLADIDVEAVLGEVLIPERQTLGDMISPAQTVAESAPVKSLRSSISVADRFMLARTLFGGDDAAFDKAIEELDAINDFDNCIIHITENYSWSPSSEGAKMIIELLQRKHL
ncbi:MAG: hypothetical protein IJ348_01360 [Alistipes sp.]|nr:hypothetical protein [Alistipes sp.]